MSVLQGRVCSEQKSTFHSHCKNRLNEKPNFKCQKCKKEFTRHDTLIHHLRNFTRKSHLDRHKVVHEKEHYVCTHCSAQYARKSFYLQHIEKCSTSSQANSISRSNRRRGIVIDEIDEEQFDLSDLLMAFTQFDNKSSYSRKL